MPGLLSFHLLAAQRGDGLRPEFLDLLTSVQRVQADTKVVDIGAVRGDGWIQSGPYPTGTGVKAFGAKVAALPFRAETRVRRLAKRAR